MGELTTKKLDNNVEAFIDALTDESKKKDAFDILQLMKQVTGKKPVLWGNGVIGFDDIHYEYASGHRGDWFAIGFSPRKQHFSIHLMTDFLRFEKLFKELGKYKTGKACIYINKLADIDKAVLEEIITKAYHSIKQS